jgi:hypothetical protein
MTARVKLGGRAQPGAAEQPCGSVVEFDSHAPGFAGAMRITFTLADAGGGTEVVVFCEGIPIGVRLEDNEMGCRSSLQNLAEFLE